MQTTLATPWLPEAVDERVTSTPDTLSDRDFRVGSGALANLYAFMACCEPGDGSSHRLTRSPCTSPTTPPAPLAKADHHWGSGPTRSTRAHT